MEVVLALLTGFLVAISVYLMLSGNVVRFLLGLVLIGNAINLLIFAVGRLTGSDPPIIPAGSAAATEDFSNALPQALILTAIVIAFGLQAFAFVLGYRASRDFATEETDDMRLAEEASEPEKNVRSAGDPSP